MDPISYLSVPNRTLNGMVFLHLMAWCSYIRFFLDDREGVMFHHYL